MLDALKDLDRQDGNDIQSLVSQLSRKQINDLYNHLYSIKGRLDEIDPEKLKALSTGRIDLATIDQVIPLLEKAETMSKDNILTDQTIKLLLSVFSVTDIVDALKQEQVKYDSYKGLSDDYLLPY